ncbi:MAG: hypothetical protein Q6373_007240, partial [Candidatus Sigynarchaeota archaeon]
YPGRSVEGRRSARHELASRLNSAHPRVNAVNAFQDECTDKCRARGLEKGKEKGKYTRVYAKFKAFS